MKNDNFIVGLSVALLISLLASCGSKNAAPSLSGGDCHEMDLKSFAEATPRAYDNEVPKIIWTFWDKGEDKMPAFHRFNVNNWRAKLEKKGYKIIVANSIRGDANSLSSLLVDDKLLPEFFYQMENKTVSSPTSTDPISLNAAVVQSDFVRLALLEQFGGVWMDATDVLIEDMDTLLQPFEQSPQTVAGFVQETYASDNSVKVNGILVDGLENWMLVAKKGSPLIKAWRKVFTEYWRTRKSDQPIKDHPLYCNDFDFGGLAPSPNYLNQHAALKYVVHYQPKLGEQIFHLALNPWWLGDHSSGKHDDGGILESATGPNKFSFAQQAIDDGAKLLKFANHRTRLIKTYFTTPEEFCTKDNFFAKIYELSMPTPWCASRK